MASFKKLWEDALKVKFRPKKGPESELPIASEKDDIARRQIMSGGTGSFIDTDAISKFRSLSSNRQERYQDFENLLSDATIAAAIEMYADDSTQYDYRTGRIIWAEAEDPEIDKAANRLIRVLGLNQKAWQHIYALCAYGDIYLRLYRDGDESDYKLLYNNAKQGSFQVRVKPQDSSRKLEEYIEYVDDPATMYDLQVRDKTAGFIRISGGTTSNVSPTPISYNGMSTQTLNSGDVDIYDRTSFVHICLAGNIDRRPELIALSDSDSGNTEVYKIKTGKSILADAYEPSQTVRLLEDSMLLSRLTKSALIRILQIEVGNLPKPEVEGLLRRVKNLIEQKMALNKQNGVVASYNSPGPMENVIYVPTKEGKGAITSTNLGGDANIKDIVDVDYFNDKKLSALKIPKQYLNYNAPEGLGNGTSLTKLSSRYAHTIMRIQNAYISGITTLLNIFFADKDLDYINKFTIKMVSPATLEDTERDEQIQSRLDQASAILELITDRPNDPVVMESLIWLFENYLKLPDIAKLLRENKNVPSEGDGSSYGDVDLGGGFDNDFGPSMEPEFNAEGPEEPPSMKPEE